MKIELIRGTVEQGVIEWTCTCGFKQQDPANVAIIRCERCGHDHVRAVLAGLVKEIQTSEDTM
jgi:hypothetical protein